MKIIKKLIRITLNSKLVVNVKHYLNRLGLSHGTLIDGFLHYLANNHVLPFRKLRKAEEKTALKVASFRLQQKKIQVFDKNKQLQKSVDEGIYEQAKLVLKKAGLTITSGIRMLYEVFTLTGRMPYQFVLNSR